MNNFLIRAFAQSLKQQKNANKDKTGKQRKPDNVQRIDISTPPNGDRKSVYSTVSKWLRG